MSSFLLLHWVPLYHRYSYCLHIRFKGLFQNSAVQKFRNVFFIKLNAPLHFKIVVLKAAWTSRSEMMECWCREGAGVFSEQLAFSWKNYYMNWVVETSLDEPRMCSVLGLCSLLMSECDREGRWQGCKSGAMVWNAARVRTCFLFQLCKTPLK